MRRTVLAAAALAAASHAGGAVPAAAAAPAFPPVERAQAETRVLEGDAAFAVALQVMIRAGNYVDALALLDSRSDLAGRDDAKRLRAQLLAELGQERDAIALLEGHLTESPGDALARFQLAELHFAAERDSAAALAYRLALAGDLDAMRRAMADARLAAIRERREWRFWAGGSVAPDSNINQATDASRVELFGLPFELDEEARRRGGVAISAFAGVERRFRLEDGDAIRVGAIGSFREVTGSSLDEQYVAVRAGPDWRLGPHGSVHLQGSIGWRWFDGGIYEQTVGARVEGDVAGGPNTRWAGALRVDRIANRINGARDGWAVELEAARTRYLGPTSLWRLGAAVARREARAESEQFWQAQISVGRLFALPLQVLAYPELHVLGRTYDEAAFAFPEKRKDLEAGVSVRLSKRDWVLFGGFPFVALSAARNWSSLDLYEFSRERVEIGFTREF